MIHTNDALIHAIAVSGLTRQEISLRTGLACTTLTRMCSGDRIGNLNSWMLVAEVLGVSVDELIGADHEEH